MLSCLIFATSNPDRNRGHLGLVNLWDLLKYLWKNFCFIRSLKSLVYKSIIFTYLENIIINNNNLTVNKTGLHTTVSLNFYMTVKIVLVYLWRITYKRINIIIWGNRNTLPFMYWCRRTTFNYSGVISFYYYY